MKRTVILFLGVLLALFAAITLLKSRPASMDAPGGLEDWTAVDKERVRRFWEVYREATGERLAGRPAEAAKAYQEALALNDAHEDALYYLGNMYLELGAFTKARAAWKRLAQVNPNSARAYAQLGELHFCFEQDALFDLDVAEAAFRRALEINKEETGSVLRLGQVALVRGDLAEARRFFYAVTGSNYKSVDAYFLNGYAAWKQGAVQEASALFAQAVRYVQSEAPTHPVPGEGDTKTGSAPMVSGVSDCPLFQTHLDDLARLQAAPEQAQVEQQYRTLDALLEQIRKRNARSPSFRRGERKRLDNDADLG